MEQLIRYWNIFHQVLEDSFLKQSWSFAYFLALGIGRKIRISGAIRFHAFSSHEYCFVD